MIHLLHFRQLLAFLASVLLPVLAASGARVRIESVKASFSEHPEELSQVIDGKDIGRGGWSVFPRTSEPHTLVVKTAQPLHALAYNVTLCFLSGYPSRYCGRFALSYTTDPTPSLEGKWERISPEGFTATGTTLKLEKESVLVAGKSDSMIGDAVFLVRLGALHKAVTGFRLDVLPFHDPRFSEPGLSWSEYRDFRLTEFRVETVQTATTNVALGSQVRASHPLWGGTPASVLTDGLPGSFNHPARADLGQNFFFEIDFGEVRQLDHLALRGRADGYALDRMSRLLVQLYDQPPGAGSVPVWQTVSRPDGSQHSPGEIDVLRSVDGQGVPKGQYLRLSSDSTVALSPQIAEVEAYETLTPYPVSIKADGRDLSSNQEVRTPPGTRLLNIVLTIPGVGLPERLPIRWRLRGLHDDWQITRDSVAEVSHPPAGTYVFEAQARHTDGEWDSSMLSLPLTVSAVFWRTAAFYWSASAAAVLGFALMMRAVIRRRQERQMAALHLRTALAEERSRIARDMHDEVGARLSQLALMQDLILRKHPMPTDAQSSLRHLAQNTRHAVDALDQVVWAVNPLHDTLAGVAEYLSHTASSYLTPLNISCRLDIPFDWPAVEVRAQVRHQLVLAFREALQNVAKHSGAESVTLTMRYNAPELLVRLVDDGCGLPQDFTGEGKDGLTNMRARLANIGGVCVIQRLPEGGTEVRMHAPLAPQHHQSHADTHRPH